MKSALKLFCIFFLLMGKTFSQDKDAVQKKEFVILFSGKNFDSTFIFAKRSAQMLNFKFESSRVKEDTSIHLTFSDSVCIGNDFEYPCYVPRGRFDDGVYISIEYSDYYEGFSKGYYIVIAASGTGIKKETEKIKKIFPKAYAKAAEIYIGCIH